MDSFWENIPKLPSRILGITSIELRFQQLLCLSLSGPISSHFTCHINNTDMFTLVQTCLFFFKYTISVSSLLRSLFQLGLFHMKTKVVLPFRRHMAKHSGNRKWKFILVQSIVEASGNAWRIWFYLLFNKCCPLTFEWFWWGAIFVGIKWNGLRWSQWTLVIMWLLSD